MAIRILICDDEPVVHESLHIYFEAEGYEVVDAYNGEEGLQKIDSSISLCILDIMMPKKSGIEVCREIRKNSTLPIVMLTAKGEEIDRILGLELGADDYIVKPFSPREVVARVKAILRRVETKERIPVRCSHATRCFPAFGDTILQAKRERSTRISSVSARSWIRKGSAGASRPSTA